jgi:hypothetical protein
VTPYAAGRLAARYGSTAVTLHIGEARNRSVAEDAVAPIESSGLEPVMKIEQGSPYPLLIFVQLSSERRIASRR